MALSAGTRLGPYVIDAVLGAGGMGEVYRATDTNLKRPVAVKVLPEQVAGDAHRLARFQREAEVLARLNHPHIASIYGLERSDGTIALVMELVEGPTLADRLARGAMPVDEALRIAQQIAEALQAAHEQGIIHRDLKPANVKVRADGMVKVLDFGLAKAIGPDPDDTAAPGTSISPTITSSAVTAAGMILGTPAYMSPEQARGQAVDPRADIWAFGCVLFEMLTGISPFGRATVPDSVAAVLEREPDWTTIPDTLPAGVRRLLVRCLTKDRQRRLRDIGDARLEVEDALASPTAERSSTAPHARRGVIVPITAVLVMAAAVVAFSIWQRRSSTTDASTSFPVRFSMSPPPGYEIDLSRSPVGISRDGRTVAFSASRGDTRQIFLRDLDRPDAVALAGSEGGFAPFFSPDGQWVGFFANQKIRKVLRSGGTPIAVVDFAENGATRNVSAAWEDDDTILFTPDVSRGIWRVPASGGTPVMMTKPTTRESFHLWPQLLPGGRALLFSAVDDGADPQVYVQRLDTGERTPLFRGHGTRYVPSGHLLFVQGGSLMAVPFDVSRLEVSGSPVPVISQVTMPFRLRTMAVAFNRLFDVSPAGTLVFVTAGRPPRDALVWVDRSGKEQPTGAVGGTYAQPRLSPDGRRIAVVVRGDDFSDVWLYEPERNVWDRFTSEGNCEFPLWSPDGTRLAYNTDRAGTAVIEWKRSDGSSAPETIVPKSWARAAFPLSWSPDGWLALVALRPAQDIWVVRPGSNTEPTPFLATPFVEGAPVFAPDGRSIAYISDETGRNEIYLRPFPGPGEKVKISSGGGNEPVWAPAGRELFYREGSAVMAVAVTPGATLKVGTPHVLFTGEYGRSLALYANYSTIDGQRFVMVKRMEEDTSPPSINVAVNWLQELTQRVPPR